jgi:hypothetical protein
LRHHVCCFCKAVAVWHVVVAVGAARVIRQGPLVSELPRQHSLECVRLIWCSCVCNVHGGGAGCSAAVQLCNCAAVLLCWLHLQVARRKISCPLPSCSTEPRGRSRCLLTWCQQHRRCVAGVVTNIMPVYQNRRFAARF